jgi:hypothetical protein
MGLGAEAESAHPIAGPNLYASTQGPCTVLAIIRSAPVALSLNPHIRKTFPENEPFLCEVCMTAAPEFKTDAFSQCLQ